MYYVIVGNIGTVMRTVSYPTASETWNDYYCASAEGVGRAAGESVVLMDANDILLEYQPPEDEELEEVGVRLRTSRAAIQESLLDEIGWALREVKGRCGDNRYDPLDIPDILDRNPFALVTAHDGVALESARWSGNRIEAIGNGYAAMLVRCPDPLMKRLLQHLCWLLQTHSNLPKQKDVMP